VGVISGLLKWA